MFCSFIWKIFLHVLTLPKTLCFYVLSRSSTSYGTGRVTLCRGSPVGPSNAVPLSPCPGAPGLCPVWNMWAFLLWLGCDCDCCGYTIGHGWLLVPILAVCETGLQLLQVCLCAGQVSNVGGCGAWPPLCGSWSLNPVLDVLWCHPPGAGL